MFIFLSDSKQIVFTDDKITAIVSRKNVRSSHPNPGTNDLFLVYVKA